MDKKNKHIEQLTLGLIQAYHSGTLTSTEMHQVELLMLENPLYNEGIEGLESLNAEEFNLDIDALSARVDQVTQEERIGFWTTWEKVAAVILVLITASGLFYFNQPTNLPTKELSALKKPLEVSPPDSSSNDVLSIVKSEIEVETAILKKEVDDISTQQDTGIVNEKLVADLEEEEVSIQSSANRSEVIQALPNPKVLTLAKPSFDMKSDSVLNGYIQRKRTDQLENVQELVTSQSAKRKLEADVLRSSFTSESKTSDLVINAVKGKVLGSDDDLPLPQVTVFIKGTVNGTQTNNDGEFNFESLNRNSTLVFTYLGYVTQEVKVGENREINIKLTPDNTALGEVVVTGVAAATPEKKLPFTVTTVEGGAIDGTRAKTNVGSTQSSTRAKPVDGFSKFNRYLKKNLRYPEAAKPLKVRGQVEVEFRLSSTGELFDFRIIKGLGFGCDEEAIRLIKEGPKWNPKTVGADKTPVLSVATVKVRFRP